MEPKKAPPPDILRRLFGYNDPEPAASAPSSAASNSAHQDALPRRRGSAQFAEPVPGDFAYSGEQPRLAGRSTKPPTPRRVAAVSRGAAREGGDDFDLGAGSDGSLHASSAGAMEGPESRDGVGSRSPSSTSTHAEGLEAGTQLRSQRGDYDIITGRYAKPQPGDFGYDAPPPEHHARPASRPSVRNLSARKRRSNDGPRNKPGK